MNGSIKTNQGDVVSPESTQDQQTSAREMNAGKDTLSKSPADETFAGDEEAHCTTVAGNRFVNWDLVATLVAELIISINGSDGIEEDVPAPDQGPSTGSHREQLTLQKEEKGVRHVS